MEIPFSGGIERASDRPPVYAYENMTQRYRSLIDFRDQRFKFIPGDINELLSEFDQLTSRMRAIATGECAASDVIMELDFVRSRMTHLIDHAKSLRSALVDLMTFIDRQPEEIERGAKEEAEKGDRGGERGAEKGDKSN